MANWHHRDESDAPENLVWVTGVEDADGPGGRLVIWAGTTYGTHQYNRPLMAAQPRAVSRWAVCQPGHRCSRHKGIDSRSPDPSYIRNLTPEQVLYQSDAHKDKVATALARIALALKDAKRPYIAFSGGKDSWVVASLALSIRRDIELVWSDDELEFPETVDLMSHVKAAAGQRLVIVLGREQHAGWFWPWRDEPFFREPFEGSLRITEPVDHWLADSGYDLVLLGTRAEESRKRRDWLINAHLGDGANGFTYGVARGCRRCTPIWDWTADDVWALLRGQEGFRSGRNAPGGAEPPPYNEAYDVYERIGVPRKRARVGPLFLAPRQYLAEGWPDLLERLEARYGQRWS